jgi:hypothetical protein
MHPPLDFRRAARVFATLAIAAALGIARAAHAHEPDAEEIALGSLVDAELAFARKSVSDGVHAAFLANFAPDGIALQPAPVRISVAWRDAPATNAPTTILDWKPAQAGVARSHDFGYTTGPYVVRRAADGAEIRHGVFFTVWQRDARNRWKVLLDAGTATQAPIDFAGLGAAPRPGVVSRHGEGRSRDLRAAATLRARLLADEASAFGARASGLVPNDYARLLRDDARMMRDQRSPLATRPVIARAIAQRVRRVTWIPIDAKVAASADMAVTYGRYREIDRGGGAHDGYYAHLWLRDAGATMRLAYDIALPDRS